MRLLEPITTLGFIPSYDPSTLKHFTPPNSVYTDGRTYTRGGTTGEYTARYLSKSCIDIDDNLEEMGLPAKSGVNLHNFTRIVLLTDGTCGSACSQFSTKLMLHDNMVRTVSYGGFGKDDVMDTSAFAGGNVEQFGQFWKVRDAFHVFCSHFLANFIIRIVGLYATDSDFELVRLCYCK